MTAYQRHDPSFGFEHLGNTSVLNEAQACIRNISIRHGVPEHEVSGVVMAVFEELGLCEVRYTLRRHWCVSSPRDIPPLIEHAEALDATELEHAEKFARSALGDSLALQPLATVEQLAMNAEDYATRTRRVCARTLAVTKRPSKNPAIPQRNPEKG